MPYPKEDKGPAQCPGTNWDNDAFNKNCYKKCQSGFEVVPHLTAWKCRPKCSSMNSYAGVGGCWNNYYSRQTRTLGWKGCKRGWDFVMLCCRKHCRAGFTAPWMVKYCYKTLCPANFSPRLSDRYCARNSKNRQKQSTTCKKYHNPDGQELQRNTFGRCKVQCKKSDVDGGLLGSLLPASLSISIQDIAEALQAIIDVIMDLPLVKSIQNAINRIIQPMLEPNHSKENFGLLKLILNLNLDFLELNLYNPFEDILDMLPALPLPVDRIHFS